MRPLWMVYMETAGYGSVTMCETLKEAEKEVDAYLALRPYRHDAISIFKLELVKCHVLKYPAPPPEGADNEGHA